MSREQSDLGNYIVLNVRTYNPQWKGTNNVTCGQFLADADADVDALAKDNDANVIATRLQR
jgi:hypothetical protein